MPTIAPAPIAFTAQPSRATASNGRKPGSTCAATCHVCGAVEQAAGASSTYRCAGCRDRFAAEILALSDAGYSQGEIAARVGLSQNTVSNWCKRYSIVTRHKKPQHDKVARAVGIGKKPADVMPSSRALGLVSIFSMGA
jgi:hypothetical protein